MHDLKSAQANLRQAEHTLVEYVNGGKRFSPTSYDQSQHRIAEIRLAVDRIEGLLFGVCP